MFRFTLVAASLVLTAGCSTTLSTLQPAAPLAPGKLQMQVAQNVNIPAGRIVDAINAGAPVVDKYATNSNYAPTQDEQKALLKAAAGLALNPPGTTPDVMVRVGVVPRFDAGARFSGNAVHIDGKYEFTRGGENDWHVAMSLGLSTQLYRGALFDALDYAHIGSYSRYNLEAPVIIGRSFGSWGHFWFGPKYIGSLYSLDASLKNVGAVTSTSGSMHHAGGFVGGAVGYKYVFFMAELTAMYAVANPEIMGERVNIGGPVIMPSAGIMVRFP